MEKYDLEQLTGKTISFGTDYDNLAVANVAFKLINGKIFALGCVPKGATKNDVGAGKECGVAWDSTTDFMVFESESEYAQWMKEFEDE